MHRLIIQVFLITLGSRGGVSGFVLQQQGDSALRTADGTTVLFPVPLTDEVGSEGEELSQGDEALRKDEQVAQEDDKLVEEPKPALDDGQTSTDGEPSIDEDSPVQNQDDVKVSLTTQDNQGKDIYGQTNAEKLGDLSTLDVLFRKRRQTDCEESAKSGGTPDTTNEAPVEEVPPPVPESNPAAAEVAAANVPEETPADVPEVASAIAPKDLVESVPEDAPADAPEETPSRVPEETPVVNAPKEAPATVPEAPANAADKTDVSVEEVKLISFEEISNGEIKGEGYGRSLDNNLPGSDYLAPPAETAICTNYHAESPAEPVPTDGEAASNPPEPVDPPVTNLS